MDITKEPQRIISFCTGIRGLERGIERVNPNVRTVAYVEIEAFICENLACETEAGVLAPAPIWTNLKTFDGLPFRGKVHGIIGGYPCQPFSMAGDRKGTEDPRHLWPYICDAITAIRPVWCFFENVAGHLSLGYGEVYRSLRDMGYRVEAGIFTAEEVGAPHERERLFILAVMADMPGIGKRGLSECEPGQERSKQGNSADVDGSSESVAYPKCISGTTAANRRQEFGQEREQIRHEFTAGGKQLEHAKNQRQRRWKIIGAEHDRKVCEEKQTGNNGVRCEPSGSGVNTELGYAGYAGLQRDQQHGSPDKGEPEDISHRSIAESGNDDRWPSRRGEQQYEWEEPRTISKEDLKSRLGVATDGHNFREDLLRAAGNSVVEQTAGLAFAYLWNKHLND